MRTIIVISICLGLALAGCTTPSTAGADNETAHDHAHAEAAEGQDAMHAGSHAMHMDMAHVKVFDGRYEPDQVNASTTGGIHFTNEGQVEHTVTIVDETARFVLDVTLKPGESTHFQPGVPGTYHAFCREHEGGGSADLHVIGDNA